MNLSPKILICIVFFALNHLAHGQERLDIGVKLDGTEISMPWNGGFNAPQFANIDLNRDGIQDMITFDRQGDQLRTYIRYPATGRWELDWSYTHIFPAIVDWIQIADYDGDGVEDLFTSASQLGVTGITVYKGKYENDVWSFTKHIDRGKEYLQVMSGISLANLFVSWDDIPSITDVDGDGDLDILAFEPGSGSYITYFSNQSVESGWGKDSLRFDIEDTCWGKILENDVSEEVFLSEDPNVCSDGNLTDDGIITPRHAGSTIYVFDPDADGDKDALIGDITSRRLVFLKNGLNAAQAWITEQDSHWPSTDVSVDLPFFVGAYGVQLDDDPEIEILAAVNSRALSEDKESVWRYDAVDIGGALSFMMTETDFFQQDMIELGSYTRPAIADINGDGLLDLVVGGYHYEEGDLTRAPSLWYFQNEGSASQPYFNLVSRDYLNMSEFSALMTFDFSPAFGDIDGNGSIDLVVGEQNGKLFFFKNLAGAGEAMSFATALYPYMNINVGVSATPQIADINGDGLSDLVIGERTGNSDNAGRCSNLNYFENIGTIGDAIFSPDVMQGQNTQCFGRLLFDIPIGLPQFSAPAIYRSGGQLHLITGLDRGRLEIYTGLQDAIDGTLTQVDGNFGQIDVGNRSAPAMADLNGDGLYELIVGNQRGGLELFATSIEADKVSTHDQDKEKSKPYTLTTISSNGLYQLTWLNDDAGEIQILDSWGRMILGFQSTHPFQSMDLSSFPSGMYVVRIESKKSVWIEQIIRL